MTKKYDLIIIGAGPAGLTAAIYAARYKLNAIVIGKEIGGLAATAHKIYNFPSYMEISGVELMQKIINQVKKLGIEIINEEVLNVKGKDNNFSIITKKNKYFSKKIIYAGGMQRSKLKIKNEEKFIGKGISYCATCDAPLFRGKVVAVIGGGNAALSSALLLAEYASRVYVVYRKKFFKAEPSWIELIKKNKKIIPIYNEGVVEIMGKDKVEGVKLSSGKNLELEGVSVEIGGVPDTYILSLFNIKRNKKGYIVTDKKQRTSVKGLYAAGDVTDNSLKQIITSAGEGAVAAFEVYQEIKGN